MKKYVFLILINIITHPKLIEVEREYLQETIVSIVI